MLVVDDASTDATADISETWVARDPRFRVSHRVPPEAVRARARCSTTRMRWSPAGSATTTRGWPDGIPRMSCWSSWTPTDGCRRTRCRRWRRTSTIPRRVGADRRPDRQRPGQRAGPDAGHRVRRVQLAGPDRPRLVRLLGARRQRPVHALVGADAAAGRPLAARRADRGPRPRAAPGAGRLAYPLLPSDVRRPAGPRRRGARCCGSAPGGSRATTSAGGTSAAWPRPARPHSPRGST